MKVGLIGDYQEAVTAHQAIPKALHLAAGELSVTVEYEWLPSSEIQLGNLKNYNALWCVPASPYENTENVLSAIKYARTENVAFLGTCGGYQHAALEFIRNELHCSEAENAEINPQAAMPVINTLSCKLYDEEASIELTSDSQIAQIYGSNTISEEYFCGYGVNREYLHLFDSTGLCFSGFDNEGDPRSLEIIDNNFFIGTAFQPERSALKGLIHPLITEFIKAGSIA